MQGIASVSINPATGEKLGEVPLNTAEEVQEAIQRARNAQKIWREFSVKERAKRLHPLRRYIIDHADELVETICADNGKSRVDALTTEVLPAALATHYYCRKAPRFLKDKFLHSASFVLSFKRSKLVRVPHGVVGIIAPWNYPFAIPYYEILTALLAGNGVVFKAASQTQQVGLALKQIFEVPELPDGLFQYVNVPGRVAGQAFFDGGIDKLSFIGSVGVGKQLMATAAKSLTPITLELGGKDPMIVCEDADLDRAAAGAVWGGFANTGQSCAGIERIYVHEAVYGAFLEKLKSHVLALNIGSGLDYNTDIGCMTTSEQIETVKEHIQDALEKGAQILVQKEADVQNGSQHFLPATVLVHVNHQMKVMREETFGPVVGVMPVKNDEEAIQLANDSDMGLTASVWTRNRSRGEAIARRLEAGAVTINDHLMSHGLAETPWGGFKNSGIGRSHGELGLLEMTQAQVIVKDILPGVKKDLWWYPASLKLYNGLKGLGEMLFSRNWQRRVLGAWRLLKIIPRIFGK